MSRKQNPLTKRQSDNIRQVLAKSAPKVASIMSEVAAGDRTATTQQINAAKLVLDKCVPSLQAVDSTVKQEAVQRTKEELYSALLHQISNDKEALAAIVESNPALAKTLQEIAIPKLKAVDKA